MEKLTWFTKHTSSLTTDSLVSKNRMKCLVVKGWQLGKGFMWTNESVYLDYLSVWTFKSRKLMSEDKIDRRS